MNIVVIVFRLVWFLVLKWVSDGLFRLNMLISVLFLISGIISFECEVELYVMWLGKVFMFLICWVCCCEVVVLYMFLFSGMCM